jgi:hypothetical protein
MTLSQRPFHDDGVGGLAVILRGEDSPNAGVCRWTGEVSRQCLQTG